MTILKFIRETLQENYSDRASEMIKWGLEKGILDDNEFVKLDDGDYTHTDHAWQCDNTGAWFSNDECSFEVQVRYNRWETWCQSAVDDNAFYCNNQDCYYSDNHYTSVRVDGELVCLEENDGIYEWADGSYHWEEEVLEDEYDIPDYHDCDRPWEYKSYKDLVFGCELEILANDDRVEIKDIANNLGLIGERDGSLDDRKGIEIIGPPLSLKEYQDENGIWLKFLSRIKGKALGWDADRDNKGYGLHISVNRAAMSTYHSGKLIVFINQNKDFCEKIAGRKNIHYCKFDNRKKVTEGKRSWSEKYEALSIASDKRLECRMFRSTINPKGFLKNVEFLASAVEFTKNASAQHLTAENYQQWLKKNTRNYKHIARFLKILKEKQNAPV